MTAPKFYIGQTVSAANMPHQFKVLAIKPDFTTDEVCYLVQMAETNVRLTLAESVLKANS